MTFPDEEPPPRPKKLLIPPVLDSLGVEELRAYIADLQAEIARVETAIAGKQAHAAAAALFFKTP